MPGSDKSQVQVSAATWDRAVQLVIAAGMFYLGISGWFGEGLSAALRIGSLVPILTALFGWTPLQRILTRRTSGAAETADLP